MTKKNLVQTYPIKDVEDSSRKREESYNISECQLNAKVKQKELQLSVDLI